MADTAGALMSRELVLCALRRIGEPATAADVAEHALTLAMEEGWPRHTWAALNPQATVRHLRAANCVKAGEVRDPTGNNRPMWQPPDGQFDRAAALPPRPSAGGEHALAGRSPAQVYALFDALDTTLKAAVRQRDEQRDLQVRHDRELADLARTCKQQLLAVGLGGDDGEG